MDNGYRAREAAAANADRLYPLIEPAIRGLTLDAWREFVAAAESGKKPNDYNRLRGVIAIECERGYARALFIYSVVPTPGGGATLVCDNLILPDQFGVRPLVITMIAAIRDLARRYECKHVHINVIGVPSPVAELLRRAGFSPSREIWCQQIASSS